MVQRLVHGGRGEAFGLADRLGSPDGMALEVAVDLKDRYAQALALDDLWKGEVTAKRGGSRLREYGM